MSRILKQILRKKLNSLSQEELDKSIKEQYELFTQKFDYDVTIFPGEAQSRLPLLGRITNLITFLKDSFYKKSSMILENPPASFLLKIADFLPKKNRQNLHQEISDIRLEYYETLKEKKIWRARVIVVFYYFGVGWSLVMWASDRVKEFIGIIPKKD